MTKLPSKTSAQAIALRSAVICDAVRREDNNKWMIIGGYSDSINLNVIPSMLQLTVFCTLRTAVAGVKSVEFEIKTPVDSGTGRIDATEEGFPLGATFDLPVPVTFVSEGNGEVTIKWRANEGEWSEGVSWNLQAAPDATILSQDLAQRIRENAKIQQAIVIDVGQEQARALANKMN